MNELKLRPVTVEGAAVAPTQERLTAVGTIVTALLLFGPLAGVAIAAISLFGHGVTILDLGLGVAFYAITGHGISVGYHRMLAHRACKPTRAAKIALAVAGSMGFEGALNGWVAIHRRHHAYTDRPGDPHSPHLHGNSTSDRIRGAFHAHMGWLFRQQPTEIARWAPDLAADRDLVRISAMFPFFCVVSLALPTAIGWAVTGTYAGAVGGFVWGASSASSFSSTRPSPSTPPATSGGRDPSRPESTIGPPTSPPSPCWRWATTGTTCIIRIRASPVTASSDISWIRRRG